MLIQLFGLTLNVQKSAGKLAGQYMDQDCDEPKKKRSRIVKSVKPSVMSRFCGVDSATVKKARILNVLTVIQNMAQDVLWYNADSL